MTKVKNPFPRKSVVTPEGGSGVPLYTLVTPQVEKASQLAVEYLEDGLGQVITIQGPYGSGKSHLINFAIQRVQQTHGSMDPKPRVFQIYHRASSANFVSFYKELIKQIGFETLQEVNDRFLGVVALQEMSGEFASKQALIDLLPPDKRQEAETRYADATRERRESLRADPKIIYRYLDNLIIQPETVYDQRASELQTIAGENFKKAFFYLPDVNLGRTAYSWFVGDEMTEENRARLGVSTSIKTALDAKFALSLLVTLFRHAGIRLLIYFDQIEKLLIGTDSQTLDENRGVIQSLAELCPPQNAFLALAGANDGWELVREDFWSRVGPTKFQLGTISSDWACALIKVYLGEKEAYTVTSTTEETDIAPFTFAAADEILKISNGNVRVFLQVCHEVFKQHGADGGTIGPVEVNSAVATQFDEGSVLAEIESILTQRGLRYELQSRVNSSSTPDILIGEAASPLAVVEISNSLFYLDEAENAVEIVNRRDALARRYPDTRFIVVTIGYASKQVTDNIKRVVDNYLVYDGQGFAKKFQAVLDGLAVNGQPNKDAQSNVPEVKDDLKELLAAREQEISELNERLQTLAQEQSAKQVSPRHREWRVWLRGDQQKWEERQKQLVAKAQAQRVELQQSGEAERLYRLRRSFSVYAGGVVVFTLVALLILTAKTINANTATSIESVPFYWLLGGLTWFVILAASSYLYYEFFYLDYAPLGFRTDEIGKYPGDLGELIMRARTTSLSKQRSRLCLRNDNPIIKYFGALNLLIRAREPQTTAQSTPGNGTAAQSAPDAQSGEAMEFSERAVTENWKPLYLAYLRLAFRSKDLSAIQEMLDLMIEANIEDPRILYLIALSPPEFHQQLDIKLTGANASTPAAERIVVHALFADRLNMSGEWGRSAVVGQPLVRFAQAVHGYTPYYNALGKLADAYRYTGQFWQAELEAPVEVDLNEDELSSAIQAFSPHLDSGLASFPDLPGHNSYMRLYRFFSEIQWRFDQGDVVLKQ